jgi:hypothetical protein
MVLGGRKRRRNRSVKKQTGKELRGSSRLRATGFEMGEK